MSEKREKTGNTGAKAGNVHDKASAKEKDRLIEELKSRVEFLKKELESGKEKLYVRTDECEGESSGREQIVLALRESEARLRLAQQVAKIGTFEWNIQTGMNKWTPELEAMYGLQPGSFPGTEEAWEQLVHPEDRQEAVRRVNEAMEKGGFEGEWRVVWPDGSVHWLYGRSFVFKDEFGKPLKLIGVNIDITGRKQMEEELRRGRDELEVRVGQRTRELRDSNERLALSMKASQSGTFDWDAKTDVNVWSDELLALYGLEREEFVGTFEGWLDCLVPEDREKGKAAVLGSLDTGAFELEFRIRRQDTGEVRWMYGRGQVFYDRDGKPERMIGTNVDITERKHAEEEREKVLHRLGERVKELNALHRMAWIFQKQSTIPVLLQEMVSMLPPAWQYPDVTTARVTYDGNEYRTKNFIEGRWRQIAEFVTSNGKKGAIEIFYIEEKLPEAEGPFLTEERNLINSMAEMLRIYLDRKQAEEALRDSQMNLSSIFRAAPTGIGVVVDRVIKEVNDRLCEMTGYNSEELLGKSARILYPSDEDYQYVGQEKYHQISQRGTGSVETRWIRKDGRIIDVLLSSTPLKPGNLSAGVTFTALDITERKRAEERIANLASFPELNPNPIFEISTDGLVRYANHAAKQLFPDLAVLRTDHPILSGFNMIVGDLRGGKSYLVRDIKFKDTYLQQSIHLVPDSENVRFYVLDITERKRAEEALIAAKTDAELYLDLMGHDISNMHQIILGNLELAQGILKFNGRLESGNKELIDTSITTLQRSAKLIETIRNIQKLRRGEFELEVTNLGEMLDWAIKRYSGLPGRDVSVSYEPVHDCYVMANVLLKEIFNNLIDNAVNHCDDPVRIGVSVAPAELDGRRYYRVVVEDNGRGIPDNLKSRIFSRLERGETKARGTGLGLYIVRMLVEGFGGSVVVEDRVPGDHAKGARFVVMLPAA
jgi:PAS domain S-box-containing protein